MKSKRRLTAEQQRLLVFGLLAGGATLASVYTSPALLLVGAAILLVIMGGALWPVLSICGLTGSVAYEQRRCRQGEATRIRIVLRNYWPWPAWGILVDPWGDFDRRRPMVSIPFVPPFGTIEISEVLPADQRGVYPTGRLRAFCRFPLGLFVAFRWLKAESRLVVWPARVPVREFDDGFGMPSALGTAFRNRPGHSGEVRGVRDYRPGDMVAHINWRQSARHDRLIVCERQTPTRPQVQLVVDLDPRAFGAAGEGYEKAIQIAAGLAEWSFARGAAVELVTDQVVEASTRTGALDHLATLPPFALLPLRDAEPLRPASAARIVITTAAGQRRLYRPKLATHWVVIETSSDQPGKSGDEIDDGRLSQPCPVWWSVAADTQAEGHINAPVR